MTDRIQVTDEILLKTLEQVTIAVAQKIEKHGRGAYVSSHETLGIVAEEYHELVEAVRQNDPSEIATESLDVAVACIFGVASQFAKEAELAAANDATAAAANPAI